VKLKSLSLKCEYSAGEGEKYVYYVKGNNVRFEGTGKPNNESATIITEDKLYNWNLKTKEGFIMPLRRQEDEGKTTAEEIIDNLEANKQHCQPAVVSDSVFEPPTDVKFNDLSKLMENL